MAIKYSKPPQPLQAKPVEFIPQQLQERLGKGLGIPLVCINNTWQTLGGVSKIEQDMYLTIMTPVGRHFMQPDFGSIIPYMLMEPITATTKQQMSVSIKSALKIWVPQITVTGVTFDDTLINSNVVLIDIQYFVNGTNSQQTLTVGYTTPDSTQSAPAMFMVNDRQVFQK